MRLFKNFSFWNSFLPLESQKKEAPEEGGGFPEAAIAVPPI
jgi:hypothetical protein